MPDKIFQGMAGAVVRVQTGMDLIGCSKAVFKVRRPDFTSTEWPAITWDFGQLCHKLTADDIDLVGPYEIQPRVEWEDGKIRIGPIVFFNVDEAV